MGKATFERFIRQGFSPFIEESHIHPSRATLHADTHNRPDCHKEQNESSGDNNVDSSAFLAITWRKDESFLMLPSNHALGSAR